MELEIKKKKQKKKQLSNEADLKNKIVIEANHTENVDSLVGKIAL